MLGDIVSMVLALLGTGCVLVMTYYASRWYARRMGPSASGRHLKLVDRLPVGKSASICIMELGGRQYLMGISETGVRLLKELEEPLTVPEVGGEKDSFHQLLRGLMGKKES